MEEITFVAQLAAGRSGGFTFIGKIKVGEE
jgi:hypothetical protein